MDFVVAAHLEGKMIERKCFTGERRDVARSGGRQNTLKTRLAQNFVWQMGLAERSCVIPLNADESNGIS